MVREELDWDDLRYFLRAVQAGSLAGAARSLGVEHTTVGRRLAALERALGAPLVLRSPDGLRLTPLGEKAAPFALELERAVTAIGQLAISERARVRLAVPSGFSSLFTAHIAELCRAHPGLSLELSSGARATDLHAGEADLALRIGPIADENLVVRKLRAVGFAPYASEAYLARHPSPVDLSDLSGHQLIGYDPSLAALPAAQWIEQRSAQAPIALRSRELTDMTIAAASGLGLALLPCLLGDAEPALRRLTPAVLATRALSLAYRREARLSEQLRAVIRFVTHLIDHHAARIGGVRE